MTYIDPTGEILFFFGVGSGTQEVENVANDGLFGVDLEVDDRGMASLVPNDEVGPPAPGQQALADTLASAINHPQNIGLTVTSGDSGVIFGQYISATIDIGDIAQVGSGAGVSTPAILAHEVAEQTVAQTQGLSMDATGHAIAHPSGVAAQEKVSGFTRLGVHRDLRNGTGAVTAFHRNGDTFVIIRFQFANGNLRRVERLP